MLMLHYIVYILYYFILIHLKSFKTNKNNLYLFNYIKSNFKFKFNLLKKYILINYNLKYEYLFFIDKFINETFIY